jgi:cytochrome c oxidase subunit 1
VYSWFKGEQAPDNPWDALTLEWTTSSPPIPHNWVNDPVLSTGPYDYGEEYREARQEAAIASQSAA